MVLTRAALVASLSIVSSLATGPALAQAPPSWAPLPKGQDAAARAMVDSWTPGEAHARLAALAGEWTFTSRLWLAPGTDPEVSSGTARAEMLLGGRYLQVTLRGRLTGLPYEGRGVRAFDNTTGQYQAVWMDSLSTTLLFMTGTYDAAARAYTLRAELPDLVDPSVRITAREVLTVLDANAHRVEVFETRGTETFKRLEFLYTRRP